MSQLASGLEEHLYERIAAILDEARSRVARTVNTAMVHAYWLVGREIVEVEQGGKERAGYGDELIRRLTARLTRRFGKGFDLTNLKRMRQFYRAFPEGSMLPVELGGAEKGAAARHLSRGRPKGAAARRLSAASGTLFPQILSWTHYRGFCFVARQKRLTLEGDHFYVDLVFYNRLLRCFVLVDIKLGKLTHQDLGQMQMYVNYFDRFQRAEHEAKTIGIVLCSDKNDAMVKITLPEDNEQILAARYQMYLPTEEELRAEITREREEAERVLALTQHTTKTSKHRGE